MKTTILGQFAGDNLSRYKQDRWLYPLSSLLQQSRTRARGTEETTTQ